MATMRFPALFVVLIAGAFVDPASQTQCGHAAISPKFTRIVGGHVAVPGSWPWMVMLNELSDQACGGALLNEHWIVTAAHCFDEVISRNPTRWDIYAGKFHIRATDATEQHSKVMKIIRHPSYDFDTVQNDVALMLLEHPVHYTTHVAPICLPESAQHPLNVGDVCVTTGWGQTQGTSDDGVLNQVRLPILGDPVCSQSDWYGEEYFPNTMICAGYANGGHDTCQGDSGGPFQCKTNGTYYILGVTSWGIDCALPRQPGVYTDLRVYIGWIKETMRKHGHPYQDTRNGQIIG